MKLSLTGRIVLTVVCFGIALVSFMIKLPAVFRGHDTELHAMFYFLAAGFLNFLFVKRSLVGHVLVFVLLYAMGTGIEYAQEYSNSFVGQRIHGRYDPEDIQANLKGLIYFSILWIGYVIFWYAARSMRPKDTIAEVQKLPADDRNVITPLKETTNSHHLLDRKDEEKLQMAIQLLTEVMNRNPGRNLEEQLRTSIMELKDKIQENKKEARLLND